MRRFALATLVLLLPLGLARAQSAAARQGQGTAFWGTGPGIASNLFDRVTGSIELSVTDRVTQQAMANGDEARLRAEVRVGTDTYRVELDEAGFQKGARGIPLIPLYGGARLDVKVFGNSGQGPSTFTGAPAVVSVWGLARVYRNGQLLTDAGRVFVTALSAGTHADDGSFKMLANARPEDSEVVLIVDRLPPNADPRGFWLIGYDDVRIEQNGRALASRQQVDAVTEDSTRAGSASGSGMGGSGLLYGGGTLGNGVPTVSPSDVIGIGGAPLSSIPAGAAPATTNPASTAGANAIAAPSGNTAAANATAAAQAANTPLPSSAANAAGTAATNAAVQAGLPTQNPNSDPLASAEVLGPSAVVTGIPATPPVANNGQNVTPLPTTPAPLGNTGATPLISTPAPITSQAATVLPQTPTPLNAIPATQTPGAATALPVGITPLNALPALPAGTTVPAAP